MLARTAEIGQKRTLNGFQNSDMNNILNKLTVVAVDPPDEESATVTLRSEHSELVAFCWPCDLKVGDTVENRLSVLDADVLATYLSDWSKSQKEELSQEWIERTGHYTYRGRGRVIDQAEGLVEVQGFVIEMPLLSDEYVDFEISRLDLNR
jgi:hypothetical protein